MMVFLCFSHNCHCCTASFRSLYHFRLIYGGLAGLCCWALYSDADCYVWWALSSCSLGQHLFITTIFANHIFIQLCSHPYATLCHGGLAGLGHQAAFRQGLARWPLSFGASSFGSPLVDLLPFLAGLPLVVLFSCHSCAIWVIRGGQPGLCCTACLCLAALHITSH